MNKKIAIAIFAYKRPDKLRKMIESLLEDSDLLDFNIYVFIDGAVQESFHAKTLECTNIAKNLLPRGSKICMRPENFGSKKSIIEGITEALRDNDSCIILEDDLMVIPGFIAFMKETLTSFSLDKTIIGVSGYQPIELTATDSHVNIDSTLIGYRPQSWGWGTWKDRWIQIDWDLEFALSQISNPDIRKAITRMGTDVLPMIRSSIEETIDAWDSFVCLNTAALKMKFLYPRTTFIKNDGFGPDSTHTILLKRPKMLIYRKLEFFLRKLGYTALANFVFDLMIIKHYSIRSTKVERLI